MHGMPGAQSAMFLRTSEWTAREYVTNSWERGVILISRDWILRLVSLFSGKWGEIVLHFAKKTLMVPSFG